MTELLCLTAVTIEYRCLSETLPVATSNFSVRVMMFSLIMKEMFLLTISLKLVQIEFVKSSLFENVQCSLV